MKFRPGDIGRNDSGVINVVGVLADGRQYVIREPDSHLLELYDIDRFDRLYTPPDGRRQ